jgi:hypothetical protein
LVEKNLLTILTALSDLFDFLMAKATCSFQFSLQSKIIPRTFIDFFALNLGTRNSDHDLTLVISVKQAHLSLAASDHQTRVL